MGVYCLALVPANTLPKTPLGGIHISQTKQHFLEGSLHPCNILMCPHTCVTNLPKPRQKQPGNLSPFCLMLVNWSSLLQIREAVRCLWHWVSCLLEAGTCVVAHGYFVWCLSWHVAVRNSDSYFWAHWDHLCQWVGDEPCLLNCIIKISLPLLTCAWEQQKTFLPLHSTDCSSRPAPYRLYYKSWLQRRPQSSFTKQQLFSLC